MPINSWRVRRIMTKKAARYGKQLRKMSIGVQIWTRLEELDNVNFAIRRRQLRKLV
jgi:hypothetical protein